MMQPAIGARAYRKQARGDPDRFEQSRDQDRAIIAIPSGLPVRSDSFESFNRIENQLVPVRVALIAEIFPSPGQDPILPTADIPPGTTGGNSQGDIPDPEVISPLLD